MVIFQPVKAYFNKIRQHLKLATLGSPNPINCCKTNFTRIFKEPWDSITVALKKKGFQKCGISPLNRSAIDVSRLSGESGNTTNNLQQQSAATSNCNQQPLTKTFLFQKINRPQRQRTATHLWQQEWYLRIYDTFIFPEINQQKKHLRVNTKSRVLTSDEHMQMYDEKISKKKREAEEAKEKRKNERERRKAEKERQKKQVVESEQEADLE